MLLSEPCWWEDTQWKCHLWQAELSYNAKRSDSCRCESQEAGVFTRTFAGGQRSQTVRKRAIFPAGCALKQAAALLYNLCWSEITVTSAVLCRDLLTDDNALLCGRLWIWQNYIHTRFLFLSRPHTNTHTSIASLWTTAFLCITRNGMRRKWKCALYIKCTARPDKEHH